VSARLATAAALALAVALPAGPAHAQSKTCEEVFSRVEQREKFAPFVVGDSVTVPAGDFLGEMGFAVDAMACRTFAQGLDVLRERRLSDVVVVALGSNGTVSGAELEAALEMVGPFGRLFLVLPKDLGGGPDRDGRLMRAFERAHPDQVTTLDWPAFSSGRGGWFAPDGLHITTEGARGFAEMINEAVQFAPPEQVKRPPRPEPPRPRPARPAAPEPEPEPSPVVTALWSHLSETFNSVVMPGVRLLGRVVGDPALAEQDL
jgi:hypothetical protein